MQLLPRNRLTILLVPCVAVACRTGRHEYVLNAMSVTPAERSAMVAALPPCAPIAPAPANWPIVRVTPTPGTIQLPRRLAVGVAEVPTNDEQSWADSTVGNVSLQLDRSAGVSSGFMITPGLEFGMTYVHEGDCAQLFDGRLSRLRRVFWVNTGRANDTTFVATTDVPLGGDIQLGAGVISSSRAGRDSLLSALASMRLNAP
jgi:hypothetical protein